jgi:hypothetical protein
MRYLIWVGLLLAWALWLGGLAMVLSAAAMYFATDRELAPRAASLLFLHFERFQIITAACSVILAGIMAVRPGGTARRLLLVGILLAALLAVISSQAITPRIEQMRQQGQTQTAAFKRFHGISMSLLLGELVILAACGFAMPLAVAGKRRES